MQTKILNTFIFLLFILLFSCTKDKDKDEDIEVESEASATYIIDNTGNWYTIALKNDGVDNFSYISTTTDNTFVTTLSAIDYLTFTDNINEQSKIEIVLQGNTAKNYPFQTSDGTITDFPALVNIYTISEAVGTLPEYSSFETGSVTITDFGEKGTFIVGRFEGKFKETQEANIPFQNWPIVDIHGSFKIYRNN